ncbi:hypothetical protein BTVI_145615 [Pitangus sulphuratus]|nr:hypothetical protein BTVI_145615 [Pitangus sulphuratus]
MPSSSKMDLQLAKAYPISDITSGIPELRARGKQCAIQVRERSENVRETALKTPRYDDDDNLGIPYWSSQACDDENRLTACRDSTLEIIILWVTVASYEA